MSDVAFTRARERFGTALSGAVVGSLAAHIVLTAIHNLPDQHVTLREHLPWVGEMPTWRFFGPNPGVDDTHLLYRWGRDDSPTSEWEEIDLSVQRPWWAPIWNPGTRGPKTLFDATQQVKQATVTMNGDFARICETPGYRLIADYVRIAVHSSPEYPQVQFMLMTSRPLPDVSEMTPLLVSAFHDRADTATDRQLKFV